ncbi:MAG: hypothetical protein M3P14_11890 [Chloroflexota bacterium]|nr:hypothetical protein [Chloroflexota bacterium]
MIGANRVEGKPKAAGRAAPRRTAMKRLAGDLGFFTAGLAAWLLVGILRLARRIAR